MGNETTLAYGFGHLMISHANAEARDISYYLDGMVCASATQEKIPDDKKVLSHSDQIDMNFPEKQ